MLSDEMSRRGDTLLSFGEDVRFLCFRHAASFAIVFLFFILFFYSL